MNWKQYIAAKFVHCIHSLQNPHPDQCIFVSVLKVWRSPCSRTPFQELVNNNRWLPGLPHWLRVASFASGPLWTWTHGSPRIYDQTLGWIGQKLPAILLESLHSQTGSVGLHVVMLQDIFFFPGCLSHSALPSFWNIWRQQGALMFNPAKKYSMYFFVWHPTIPNVILKLTDSFQHWTCMWFVFNFVLNPPHSPLQSQFEQLAHCPSIFIIFMLLELD
jgi:hypothetical protein